ncbi:DUF3300 domain-containing protein [Pseudomonadales bacterium]|nr:DUF3300 domain-containing protein [Pseudomonadales bacterium]
MFVNILHNNKSGHPQPIRWACSLTLLATLGLIQISAHAVTDVTRFPIAAVAAKDNATSELLSSQALEQLVAPIALYPDDLIAIVLPAATDPVGVVLAARYLQERLQEKLPQSQNNQEPQPVDSAQLSASQALDALRHYPDVLAKMNADLTWTRALGEAAASQQGDLLDAIQDYRKAAANSGFLSNDEHQVVEATENTVMIRPRDAQVIYVPGYSPRQVVVYQTAPRRAMRYHSKPSPVYYRQVQRHDRRHSNNRYYRSGKHHYLYNHRPYKNKHYRNKPHRNKYNRHDNRQRGYLDHKPRNNYRTHRRNDNSRWHLSSRYEHKYKHRNHSGHNNQSAGQRFQNGRQQRHNSHGREQHNGGSQRNRTRTSTASDQTKQRAWKG